MACLGSTFDISNWQCVDCAATGTQKIVSNEDYTMSFKKGQYFMRTLNLYGFPMAQGYMTSRYKTAADCETDTCHTCSYDNNEYKCSVKKELSEYFVPKYQISTCTVAGNDQCFAAMSDTNKCLNQTFNAGTCDLACTLGHELIVNGTGKWCVEKCGDGSLYHKYPNITCDDGNVVAGDGCSDTCHIEPPWNCTAGAVAVPTVCKKCSDGTTNQAFE